MAGGARHRFQFFVASELEVGVVVGLAPGDARHVATIRAAAGDLVDVVDARGRRFEAALIEGLGSVTVLRELATADAESDVLANIHVYVGSLTSGQRWDTLVDACVQAGASAVTPLVQGARERDAAAKRIERGTRIALAAAKQAKRLVVPVVHAPLAYDDLPRSPAGVVLDLATTFSLVDLDRRWLRSADRAGGGAGGCGGAGAGEGESEIPLVVGGAEGLPDGLVADLVGHAWQASTLGPHVLRAGLAAAVATSIVQQLWSSGG